MSSEPEPSLSERDHPATGGAPSPGRVVLGGVLMGLANLVPGISGGTMILAVGLYDRFIGAVADVTRLRLTRDSILFLAVLGCGLVAAVITCSGLAVGLVTEHRWVMYSLFIGLTLGGVPELLRQCRPLSPGVIVSVLAGIACMVALAWSLSGARIPGTPLILIAVGAAAASSMILPGVSGSYVLLILGMYDLIIGSLSVSALREDPSGSLWIIGPVVLGAGLGIALLSNILKWLLAAHSRGSHGVLLGLLLGSVLGLWPFQDPVHPDLARKRVRKATVLVLEGTPFEEVRAEHGDDLDDALLVELRTRYAGRSTGELKALGEELKRFPPRAGQVGGALGLLLVGLFLTRSLGKD